jgi:hypothetical protein
MIQKEDAPRASPVRRSESAEINSVRPTMNCVRSRIPGSLCYFVWLDCFYDLGVSNVGLSIDDVNSRGAEAWCKEIPTFDMRVGRIRAKGGAAGVPTEVMKFIADIRQVESADNLIPGWRTGVCIDDIERVRAICARRRQS